MGAAPPPWCGSWPSGRWSEPMHSSSTGSPPRREPYSRRSDRETRRTVPAMALFHRATITPTKAELIAEWAPTRSWGPSSAESIEVVGSYRFDDPDGRVGMETHLVTAGGALLQVPLTYRDEPLDRAEDALITEMQHSVLGTRWVYDGLRDPRLVLMLAAVTMTGQGEALGMAVYDGRWYIAPSNVRIQGGGWTEERVPVDGFELEFDDVTASALHNDRFDLTMFRRPVPGPRPRSGSRQPGMGRTTPSSSPRSANGRRGRRPSGRLVATSSSPFGATCSHCGTGHSSQVGRRARLRGTRSTRPVSGCARPLSTDAKRRYRCEPLGMTVLGSGSAGWPRNKCGATAPTVGGASGLVASRCAIGRARPTMMGAHGSRRL